MHLCSHDYSISRGSSRTRFFFPPYKSLFLMDPNFRETYPFSSHLPCLFASPESPALGSSGEDGLSKACLGQLSSQGDSSAILRVQFEDLVSLYMCLCCSLMPAASTPVVPPGFLCSLGCSWLQILRPPFQGEAASNRAARWDGTEGQLWGKRAGGVLSAQA